MAKQRHQSQGQRGKPQSRGQPKKQAHNPGRLQKASSADAIEEWVSALAASSDAVPSSRPASAKQRRLEKKRRRNDRLVARAMEKEAKKKALTHQHQHRGIKKRRIGDDKGMAITSATATVASLGTKRDSSSAAALLALSASVQRTAASWQRVRRTPYVDPQRGSKGKATRGIYEVSNIQPRKCDYGGLGLVRKSLYLQLLDPSFIPKFNEEFAEHIPGFFGKQRTKAMKKQLDGDMLWRRLREQRENSEVDDGSRTEAKGAAAKRGKKSEDWQERRVAGKKLRDMTPDERVDAMIKIGLI